MKKLELYFFNECPYCQIVLSAIKDLKIENKVQYFNTRENAANRDKLVKDTGRSTVPCLYIDGKPMHESRDIANWLKENSKSL